MQNFVGQSVVSASQFNLASLQKIFLTAMNMESLVEHEGCSDLLGDKVMATLFYEPSTRTRLSFEAAMNRLGGKVISTSHAKVYSSVAKGESLSDTIRTVEQYADVIVLRHHEKGSAQIASEASSVPILNAGDGPGEHPTQALLDSYTIWKEKSTLSSLKVAMVGDLKYGRTVHSLTQLLGLYDSKVYFVAPDILQIPNWVVDKFSSDNYEKKQSIEEVIGEVDVLYMTRIQKERFEDSSQYEKLKDLYILNQAMMKKTKPDMVVMHPLPRVGEIDPEIDNDPRAAYFRQAQNGMFVRMALLALVLGRT